MQHTKQRKNTRRHGFTIVELLIVIIVIAILAAIVIVAYNGIVGKARDAQRVADMKTIMKALEIYRTNTGAYPNANPTVNASGWEVSTNGTSATNFLSILTASGTLSKIPVDPVNTGNPAALGPGSGANEYEYFYYKYTAGTSSCDATRGDYYVLGVTRMDTVPSGGTESTSPGWACGTRDWKTTGAWVTGSYTN